MSLLPSSPDLSFERKQAKSLVREVRAGDASALARVRQAMPQADIAQFALADAQHVIARERGFESWPKLKAGIEAVRPLSDQIDRFLASVRDSQLSVAERIVDAHPTVASASVFTAAAAGRLDLVTQFLAGHPELVHATDGREEWPALAYACRSPFHRVSERRAEDVRQIATLLMDRGASPNSATIYFETETKKAPISVLYHAIMNDHPALVELLLSRGAKPDDGESIYHAAQFNRVACLERLVAHGADLSSQQAPYSNTPLFFLVGHHTDEDGEAAWFKGMVWLLDHGADPNVTAYDRGEAPLHGLAASAPKPTTVRAMLAHGANVNQRRNDGCTPYRIALRRGNTAIAEILLAHGATTDDVAPIEAFLGACLQADATAAKTVLASHPDLMTSLTAEDRSAICDAVTQNRPDALRLMVTLGFDLAWTRDGGTPLHWAAWTGKSDLVGVLLELGAPVNVRDTQFGSSPIGWAAHGSGVWHNRDAVYCTIIDQLLAAGADRPSSINTGGEPPERLGSRRVAAHLRAVGFAPATTPVTFRSSE